MDWTRGYTSRIRVYEVDRRTWADRALVAGVASATIARDNAGDAPLLESGSMELDRAPGDSFGERYLRLAVIAEQDGARERFDLATLLCSATGGTVERGYDKASVRGQSVLWPASRLHVAIGAWADAGENGAEAAAQMLADAIDAPVEVEGTGFALAARHVFDQGASVLDAAWALLRAGNHDVAIDGAGRVRVRPVPTSPSLELDRAHARLLVPGIRHQLDLAEVPNRYVAVEGASVAIATNDDPNSQTSTVARGFVVDPPDGIDSSPIRVGDESLDGYAERRLLELSVARDERTYSREWWPGVHPGDLVRASLADLMMSGDLRVESQSIDVSHGISVTETACMEVVTWQPE
ncbi:MAG: hypothetical protein IKG21_13230 [Atopobiaceae bacterium]|nr:hypothetical protein [Atopobiaceae bacterium]